MNPGVTMFGIFGALLIWEYYSFMQHRRREEKYQVECDRLLREILRAVKPGGMDD